MKEIVRIVLQCFIDCIALIPEQWHNNKFFWIFWSALVSLVTIIVAYFFI